MSAWSTNPQKYLVLIVDGNQHFATITKNFLRQAGISSVIHSSCAEEALGYLQHVNASVLFVDLHLLPDGGIDLVKKLRDPNFSPCPTVPIVMMANGATLQEVCDSRDAGVNEFLSKPLSLKGVERVLKSTLEKDREFVVAASYRGPDRRRRKGNEVARKRRSADLNESDPVPALMVPEDG